MILLCVAFLLSAVLSCARSLKDDANKTIAEVSTAPAEEEPLQTDAAGQTLEEEKPQTLQGSSRPERRLEDIKEEFEILRQNETDLLKIFDFIDKNIAFVDEEFADGMVDFILMASISELTPFSERYFEEGMQKKIWDYHHGSTEIGELVGSPDSALSALAKDTIKRRYKLISVEGFIEPLVDYKAYIANTFYNR